MKKNMMMRIASVLLVAVLLSTCAISGTFAKYISKQSGTSTAQVAAWNVEIVEKGKDSWAFDLFETINDTDGNAETDVYSGKIAPGTQGEFAISLSANSEVTTDYSINYNVTNTAGVPIQFSVDGGSNWSADIEDVSGRLDVNEEYDQDITIKWKWEIGDNSGSDNKYGDGATSVTVQIDVTFEQVD